MQEKIISALQAIAKDLFSVDVEPVLTRPDEQFGDFATNIAMQITKQAGKPPREVAEAIVAKLADVEGVARATIAGPGFINIRITDALLLEALQHQGSHQHAGLKVLLEYSCPNAFKELHTGHLYQTLIGDAMGRIYEASGAKVHRTSFGGDVGLHAAKCMWGILQVLGGENPDKLQEVTEHAAWISAAYVAGSKAYEEGETAKAEIEGLNKQIYALHDVGDTTSPFAHIYFTCRQWSYDYFNSFYATIEAKPFDQYYPESVTAKPGLKLVNDYRGKVFTDSDGAVVLDESKTGLHTRVFITSAGLPTYETKDLGVISLETEQFPYDRRVIITGNDQSEYMKVVFAALALINPELAARQRHVANGTVRFGDGTKMSSRLGNVTRAVDVIDTVMSAVSNEDPELRRIVALGAVKYSLLKNRVGGDIAFDLEQSISTEGNSGPYLQYALVRAKSILAKSTQPLALTNAITDLDAGERQLVAYLDRYDEVLQSAINDFSPHHLCSYLYELAVTFNRFYENNRVIGDPREAQRLSLVAAYTTTLKNGLELLAIPTPERM